MKKTILATLAVLALTTPVLADAACDHLSQEAADLDSRARVAEGQNRSVYTLMMQAVKDKDTVSAYRYAARYKETTTIYLGLILEGQTLYDHMLADGLVTRCDLDLAYIKKEYARNLDLQQEYTTRITDLTKALRAENAPDDTSY